MAAAQVHRHESELGSWEFVQREAPPVLRGSATGFWGYREETRAFSARTEVPAGDVTLIIGFGPAIDVSVGARTTGPHTSFVAGVHDTFAVTQSAGRQHGIEVNLTPLGAYRLFGVPMGELTNQVMDLEELLGREAPLLVERLYEAGDWDARFRLLDAVLARRVEAGPEPSPSVAWALSRIEETDGRVPIGALAAELGCSRRHLVSGFREQVGVPPKTLARILRFKRACGLLEQGDGLAEVAYACGYYDQAHLNRDFREFAGISPTELRARTLPDGGGIEFTSVQDALADAA